MKKYILSILTVVPAYGIYYIFDNWDTSSKVWLVIILIVSIAVICFIVWSAGEEYKKKVDEIIKLEKKENHTNPT